MNSMPASQSREKRYIAEFMVANFEPDQFMLNVPLGPIPDELINVHGIQGAAAIFRPSRRRIDAAAWPASTYILIEAKIRDPLEGLGRLQTYRDLAFKTPDLPEYKGQPFEMWLVVPYSLEWIKTAATAAGIKLVIFWQDWIADYVKERQNYFTKEYRTARDDKQRLRRVFGLD
jgi:hypothetical protein